MSTNMVLGGYVEQIAQFSNIAQRSTNSYVIHSQNSDTEIIGKEKSNKILSILNNLKDVNSINPKLTLPSSLYVEGLEFGEFQFQITNLNILREQRKIFISSNQSNPDLVIAERVQAPTRINGVEYQVNVMNTTIYANYSGLMTGDYPMDILVHYNSSIIPNEYRNQWNAVEFKISDDANIAEIKGELTEIDDIVITKDRADTKFLIGSTEQLQNLLVVFQILMSILLILSISYVMVALIHDSSHDIRLMKVIGLTDFKVWMIFEGQSILVGIFSTIFSFIVSTLFLNFLFSLISLIPGLPYSTIVIDPMIIIVSTIQAISVSFLAGLYPSLKVIN